MAYKQIGVINVGNGGYGNNQLSVEYELRSQSIAGNYSTIRARLYFRCPVWINFSSASANLHNSGWFNISTSFGAGKHLLKEMDINISHNNEGKGSFNIGYGITTSYLVSGSGACGDSLPTIPRVSDIKKFDDFDVESTSIKVEVDKKSSGFTDKLEILIGNTVVKTINPYSSNSAFSFTSTELNSIFSLMSKVNETDFTAKISTYNGGSSIGSKTVKAKGSISNANPTMPSVSWKSTNYQNLGYTDTVIKGYSNIQVTFGTATAKKGATISTYKVICGRVTSEKNASIHSLDGVDDSIVRCYVVDSRGNTTEKLINVSRYILYEPVAITDFGYQRSDGGIGNGVTITFKGKMMVGSFGRVSNVLDVQYFYKKRSETTWKTGSTYIGVTPSSAFIKTISIYGDLGADGFDASNNYDFKLIVSDRVASDEKIEIIQDGQPMMDLSRFGIGIGGKYDNTITVNGKYAPLQIYSRELNMMVPSNIVAIDENGTIEKNGTETTLKKLLNL